MASILVVGPHPDDQELGMGGTIARLAAQGHAERFPATPPLDDDGLRMEIVY